MKILHFSDVHIGVENYSVVDPGTGLSTRLQDFLGTFDEVVQSALDAPADLVLFSGDAYKSRDPSQTHQREFAKRIATITGAGIPVFLLIGNHDLPAAASRATALDIFPTLNVPLVHVADRLTTTTVHTNDGPLQVVSLPWIRRGAFLAREETRDLTLEQINRQLQDRLTTLLQREIDALDQAIPAVLTAHVSLNTAVLSSEQTMMLGHDHILLQSNLANPAFDYVALGHVHKHQVLWRAPLMAYSGSLQRIDFGEERDPKGFCLVDIDPRFNPAAPVSPTSNSSQSTPAASLPSTSTSNRTTPTPPPASSRPSSATTSTTPSSASPSASRRNSKTASTTPPSGRLSPAPTTSPPSSGTSSGSGAPGFRRAPKP